MVEGQTSVANYGVGVYDFGVIMVNDMKLGQSSPRGWSRPRRGFSVLRPGLADALFVVLLIRVMMLGQTQLLKDPGIGWHVKTGQMILQTGRIPRTDPFSYTRGGQAWVPHQWLAETMMGAAYQLGGFNGVVLLASAFIAFLFRYLYRLLLAQGAGPLAAAGFTLLAAVVSGIHWHARPLLVTLLFFLITYHYCDGFSRGTISGRRMLWLIPMFGLWANLHPGWIGGGIVLVVSFVDSLLGRRWRGAGLLGLIGAGCAGATLINPFGAELHLWLIRLLGSPFLRTYVNEYQPVRFLMPEGKLAMIFLVTLLIVLILGRRGVRRFDLLHLGVWLILGLTTIRNLPLLALLGAVQMGHWVGSIRPELWRRFRGILPVSEELARAERARPGGGLSLAAVGLMILLTAAGVKCRSLGIGTAGFSPVRWPIKTGKVLLSHPQRMGNGFHSERWGGYLIFHGTPQIRVFVDDRFGLYGEQFLLNYVAVMKNKNGKGDHPAWHELFERYDIRWALLPLRWPLVKILTENRHWRQIAQDKVAILFVKKTSTPKQ